MKKQLNNTRGETIVEIVVAFVLLMLFTAVFVTALRYAQRMILKTEQLREASFQLCSQVYSWEQGMQQGSKVSTTDYSFGPAGSSFTVKGVSLYQLEVSYTDPETGATSEHTFTSYGREAAP